jgi:hypothetical protein
MKFNDKSLSKAIKRNLREMAMEKPQGFSPHSDIERKLARGQTSIPSSLMPQAGWNAPNINFQELLASERYKTVVEKMQEYLGVRAPRSVTNEAQMFSLVEMMGRAVGEIEGLERDHKEELEELAVNLVKKELKVPEGVIIYKPNLVPRGRISMSGFKRDQPMPAPPWQRQGQQGQQQEPPQGERIENIQNLEAMLAERLANFTIELGKRRLINAILQGASARGHYMYHMVANELQNILGSEQAINKYGIIMSINDLLYWQFGDTLMGQAMQGNDFIGGKEKVLRPIPQTQPQEPQEPQDQEDNDEDEEGQENGGEGEEDCQRDDKLPTVCAWGVNFPILVHELLKGTYEVLGVKGQPLEGFGEIKELEDTLDKEIWDLRLGPPIWDRLRSMFPDEILIEENQKELQNFLLSSIFRLPARDFLVFMKEVLQKSDEGRRLMNILYTGARDNMRRRDDYQQRQNQEVPQVEQFRREVKEIADETSEDDINNFLDGLGIGRSTDDPEPETPEAEPETPEAEPETPEAEPETPEAENPAEDIDNATLSGMGLNALNFEMNKAIDAENWELVQKIQRMVDRKQRNL